MPCLASFFDAVSGVKKLLNFLPVITCPTSAFEASKYAWLRENCCERSEAKRSELARELPVAVRGALY